MIDAANWGRTLLRYPVIGLLAMLAAVGVACGGPTPAPIPTTVPAPALAPTAKLTPEPTATPTPTPTPPATPTTTPEPTETPSPTPVPTPTPTETPTPTPTLREAALQSEGAARSYLSAATHHYNAVITKQAGAGGGPRSEAEFEAVQSYMKLAQAIFSLGSRVCSTNQALCAEITTDVKAMGNRELPDLWTAYLNADVGSAAERGAMTAFMVYIGQQVLSFLGEDAAPIPPSFALDVRQGGPPRALPRAPAPVAPAPAPAAPAPAPAAPAPAPAAPPPPPPCCTRPRARCTRPRARTGPRARTRARSGTGPCTGNGRVHRAQLLERPGGQL